MYGGQYWKPGDRLGSCEQRRDKFSGLTASGYPNATYLKKVRQEEKHVWAVGHLEFEFVWGHFTLKETFRRK